MAIWVIAEKRLYGRNNSIFSTQISNEINWASTILSNSIKKIGCHVVWLVIGSRYIQPDDLPAPATINQKTEWFQFIIAIAMP